MKEDKKRVVIIRGVNAMSGQIGVKEIELVKALESTPIPNVAFVDQPVFDGRFKLNGRIYRPKQKKTRPYSQIEMALDAITGIYGSDLFVNNNSRMPEGFSIEEVARIQNKKSKLSAAKRAAIIRYFERNFEEIT